MYKFNTDSNDFIQLSHTKYLQPQIFITNHNYNNIDDYNIKLIISLSHLFLPDEARPRASNVNSLGVAYCTAGNVYLLLNRGLRAQWLVDSTQAVKHLQVNQLLHIFVYEVC